jgi:hypothetical protein
MKILKRTGLLLPLFLLFVFPMSGQVDHAPTPEVCRADADGWSVPPWDILRANEANFDNYAGQLMHDPNVTAKTMQARRAEMLACMKTDQIKANQNRYSEANRAFAIAEIGRMADYMQRHNLTAQFLQEDEQGQR